MPSELLLLVEGDSPLRVKISPRCTAQDRSVLSPCTAAKREVGVCRMTNSQVDRERAGFEL
eukprot:CAMPEP_0185706340 /NCGR_PEP_ID=MMETSP1164-20130828/21717_1 /TAXON_ID=1104430 /ORGANISM="Chrysoreinhardia sp, Strain CCMP2950" /LENGTH=60 /DNA_ID=CAMNT_0028373743 /DNA_START=52 /DNA_END=231 /DNA_ORIENTATION=+